MQVQKAVAERDGLFLCPTIAVCTLVLLFGSTAHALEETSTVEALVERGFQIAAQGELLEEGRLSCLTLRVNGDDGRGCSPEPTKRGVFRRLTKGDEAFVCVSFREWRCFRSEATERPAP